jgi:SPP1 family predicted phage head-tail adaptor
MKAGNLDRVVQFQRATLVDNGLEQVETFANHGAPVWASKTDLSDGEKWRAGEVAAGISCRFVVRFSAFTDDLTPKDRLTCEGVSYDIVGIKQQGRREGLEITAAARVDSAVGDLVLAPDPQDW